MHVESKTTLSDGQDHRSVTNCRRCPSGLSATSAGDDRQAFLRLLPAAIIMPSSKSLKVGLDKVQNGFLDGCCGCCKVFLALDFHRLNVDRVAVSV